MNFHYLFWRNKLKLYIRIYLNQLNIVRNKQDNKVKIKIN